MPVALGPLETIVNVGWGGSGVYVYVETMANYEKGEFGKRIGTLSLRREGEARGGRIIGQKNFHDAPNLFSKFRGVLYFKNTPSTIDAVAHWLLKLAGSVKVPDPHAPPRNAFCGLTSVTTTGGAIYTVANPANPAVPQFFRDVTTVTNDPNGTSTGTVTFGPLADLTLADVGKGSFTLSSESAAIWYEDTPGHYVNTRRACSELPPAGQPIPPELTEGFAYITVEVYSARASKVLPPAIWKVNIDNNQSGSDIIITGDGGPRWHLDIDRLRISAPGLEPKYDDLPADEYTFRDGIFPFEQFPKPSPTTLFSSVGTFPLLPMFVRYKFGLATLKPAYTPHVATLSGDGLPAGSRPPIDQKFS